MIRCNFLICSKHAVSVDLILRHDNREYKKAQRQLFKGFIWALEKQGGFSRRI